LAFAPCFRSGWSIFAKKWLVFQLQEGMATRPTRDSPTRSLIFDAHARVLPACLHIFAARSRAFLTFWRAPLMNLCAFPTRARTS
jgi:hypothetical protein